jgi:hypothetical protein
MIHLEPSAGAYNQRVSVPTAPIAAGSLIRGSALVSGGAVVTAELAAEPLDESEGLL